MATGASMGEGYGPVLISKIYNSLEELKGKKIATPGRLTTASLIFKIFTDGLENVDIPFDQTMERVESREFAAGVLIHEDKLHTPIKALIRSSTSVSCGNRDLLICRCLWARCCTERPW